MDVTFSNVLEGTRQYFMGLPKQAGSGGAWPAGEEAARAQSGAPTPTAPPPSAAAAPPPPRPPSEPIEPEPHIIHKATVMREAAEKRRERPDDDEAADDALSPPPHIIRRPEPEPRPSSAASAPPAPSPVESTSRGPTPRGATPVARPPEHFTPARPPDPYSSSRPPEPYPARYYEVPPEGRPPGPMPSPQPPARHGSPQTYARLSSTLPAHAARLREAAAHSPPAPRYVPAPPCDRVPPLHQPPAAPPRPAPPDARAPHYAPLTPRREPSPYSRAPHYERHPALPQRKYDPQQAYPGYRPAPTAPQPVATHRVEPLHTVQYKHAHDVISSQQYVPRGAERVPLYPPEPARRPEYPGMPRPPADSRAGYHYPSPSTSTARYGPGPGPPPAAVPVVQSPAPPARPAPRPPAAPAAPKTSYEYQTTNHVPTSPARSVAKPGYPNQQARMTVSVTSLVNQMNQTKQKRESPLDLSVKTVKNSADSSTTQDDVVDSASADKSLPLPLRPTSSSRHTSVAPGFIESHKVDFAPDFTQYRERGSNHAYPVPAPPGHLPVRYNGAYEPPPPRPVTERYPVESRHQAYPERSKYTVPVARADYVPRIDLTRSMEERRPDNRIRDDRHFIIEERKRPSGPIVSNIPEKIVRYETWTADSRIDRMSQSAREQYELMNKPVYSYSSHKQFEAYQTEQKRLASTSAYRDHHLTHVNNRYTYPEAAPRERHDYHHHDRTPSNNRHVIQKIPSHRDIHPHHLDPHSGVPADKRVLSILRNSLETKQTGFVEPARATKHVPDLIVIDDVDDSVIEITDLTKENDVEMAQKAISRPSYTQVGPNMSHHIQMPKAVDSIPSDYQRQDSFDTKSSPENDVASRIRTKAELKVMPPSDNNMRSETKQDEPKILPKSQKQHLFNQIREDQRLESVIKCDKFPVPVIPEVKTEPMNIEEIEKDAVMPIKTESTGELANDSTTFAEDDLDWASACDSFMEQLKSGAHKKKTQRKRLDTTELDNENKVNKIPKVEPLETTDTNKPDEQSKPLLEQVPVVIKQEPIDEEENPVDSSSVADEPVVDSENKQNQKNTETDKIPVDDKDQTIKPSAEKIRKKSSTTPEKRKEDQEKTKSTTPEKRKCDKDKNKTDTEQESSKKDQIKPKKSLTFSPEKRKEKEKIKKPLQDEKAKTPAKAKKSLSLQEETSTKANKSLPRQEDKEKDKNKLKNTPKLSEEKETRLGRPKTISTSKEVSDTDKEKPKPKKTTRLESPEKEKKSPKIEKNKLVKKNIKSPLKDKLQLRGKGKTAKNETVTSAVSVKKEQEDEIPLSAVVKEEPESTDDDEPLIKSKILKEKEMKYQVLKDLSEKSAYVKLECFDVDLNKNTRISIDSLTKERDVKGKTRQASKNREKIAESSKIDKNEDSSSNSDDEIDLSVASRLRVRKNIKTEHNKTGNKSPVKSTPKKQDISSASNISTPLRKPGFGDGSDFHPGWEEELYKYKRSLRMPTRLIAIPRGRSGGPFVKGSGSNYNRGSTSLPDLDPAPLSPAPSSAPSAATDDLYARRQDKMAVDSDLESNSSYSATNRLHYDSEASTSTVFSTTVKKKKSSIVDVLIQKCGQQNASKKKSKEKEKDDKMPKIIPKSTNPNELLPTPSLGLIKSDDKSGTLCAKKEKLMEDIFYLGAFRKETVSAFRTAFIKNTDGLIGATEEFAPVVLKTRTRTESRVLKQRATIKEVFGDERPASAPPIRCHDDDEEGEKEKDKEEKVEDNKEREEDKEQEKVLDPDDIPVVAIKKEKEPEAKPKLKPKKIIKDNKLKRRSSSIRDGLRSTKSLKRNDANGRLLRLKKRNSIMKSLANKRPKDLSGNKVKKEKPEENDDSEKPKEEISTSSAPNTDKPKEEISASSDGTKRRLKRLFGRRKFSSGFDYIRKKKKIIRREETQNNKMRRPAVKPSPESVHDIQKEIKGWFINKSVGETHLHRAARLGYTDCVAYCLEKMEADPSAKDNAGFTALHVAAARGHVRIARLLLQYGANVSAAANGGIRPLHEACENCHVEVIRLLLSYGADPLLGTYAGQTPEELTEGPAARFLRLHIADVQGQAVEPWRFPPPAQLIDHEEIGCDPLSSPPPSSPPPAADPTMEIQCTEMPLPPFYSLKNANGTPVDGLWCLLQDVTNLLQIKSKDSLLKQIHCGSGSPKELLREIRTQEFLERAQCHQLLCAGEKVNIRASKVALVRVTDKLRQLLKIETVLIS